MYSAYVRYSIDVKLDLDATACCFKSRWGWDEGLVNANQYYQYKNIQTTRVYMNSHEINMDYLNMYKCVYVPHILIQFLSFIQFVIHTNDAYQKITSLWSDQFKRKRFCESIKIYIPYEI